MLTKIEILLTAFALICVSAIMVLFARIDGVPGFVVEFLLLHANSPSIPPCG